MIVLIIDQDCIDAFEYERQPPILIYPHRPVTLKITLERMQTPPGSVHILRAEGGVQLTQLQPQTLRVLWLNTGL